MAAQCLVERLVEKNIISMSSDLMSTLACSVRQCLFHEPSVEVTKHCNSISFLSMRKVSYNNKRHCLPHQNLLCRPKNIQNILLNQTLGIRSIHNFSTTDLFGSGDEVQKIAKLNEKETDSTSRGKEKNLKLKVKPAKVFHHSRKRQGHSEDIKDENNKTTDDLLEGEKCEDITSKGTYFVMFLHLHMLGMHVKSLICNVSLNNLRPDLCFKFHCTELETVLN